MEAMIRNMAVVAVMAIGLAACSSDAGPKQTGGAVLGGIGGAVAGAQFGQGTGQLAAVAAGTLLGALVGSEVGSSLDKADRTALAHTTQTTLETAPSGTASTWRHPDRGHYGPVPPTTTHQTPSGPSFPDFTHTLTTSPPPP